VSDASVLTRLRRMSLARAALEQRWVRAPLARMLAPAERLEDSTGWLVVAMYHDVPASARTGLRAQLRLMRSLGVFVDLAGALELLHRPIHGRWFCLTFDDGLSGAFENAVPLCHELEIPAAFFVVPSWIDGGGRRCAGPHYMSWEDCRALASFGMEVGSHSLSHRRFSGLTEAEARDELRLSRARIEAETGRPCRHFAAPWGQPGADYAPTRDPDLAREAGYRSFFTTLPGRADADTSPWAVPRTRLEPSWGEAETRYALRRRLTRPAPGAIGTRPAPPPARR
jgi:peptidoglycan/xylan/chitin deacetylase (PgdA/CDA1 family)